MTADPTETRQCRAQRLRMVREQLRRRGIDSDAVLGAMRTVPRHRFVPEDLRAEAYSDRALPLGPQQTISQPFIVALMTQVAADFERRANRRERVLEIGTGSGYQAAVLAEIFGEVHSVELDAELARRAAERLHDMSYRNVHVHHADGRLGWVEAAPYDAILVTAGTDEPLQALLQQLQIGGRLVYPHGASGQDQMLRVARRLDASECEESNLRPVRFVPLRGG